MFFVYHHVDIKLHKDEMWVMYIIFRVHFGLYLHSCLLAFINDLLKLMYHFMKLQMYVTNINLLFNIALRPTIYFFNFSSI